MKIICIEDNEFFYNDIIEAFDSFDAEICIIPAPPANEAEQGDYLSGLQELCSGIQPDFFFSVDYHPFISLFCNLSNIKYLCWLISPYSHDFFDSSIALITTHCFCADKVLCDELKSLNVPNVVYLPFGVPDKECASNNSKASADINLWGSINKRSDYNDSYSYISNPLKDSTEGYLEGTLACKYQLAYTDFSNAKIPDYIWDDILEASLYSDSNSLEGKKHYIICSHLNEILTSIDRKINFGCYISQEAYKAIKHYNSGSDSFDENDIFTISDILSAEELISAFKEAPVNVVIPNRNRHSGISPIIWYMMWSGAFFITHKKAEFDMIPECNELLFNDFYEMLRKTAFYSSHEEDRQDITARIRENVSKNHTIKQRLSSMIETVF